MAEEERSLIVSGNEITSGWGLVGEGLEGGGPHLDLCRERDV